MDNNELIATDFQNIYSVYLHNLNKKSELFKLMIYFIISPYLVALALLSAKAFAPADLVDITNLPGFLDFTLGVVGFGLLILLYQFVEYDDNVMRCARAINNFRRINSSLNISPGKIWTTNLPVNPQYPKERKLGGSASIAFIIFSLISVCYIVKSTCGLLHLNLFTINIFMIAILLYALMIGVFFCTGRSKEYEPKQELVFDPFVCGNSIGEVWLKYLNTVLAYGSPADDDKGPIIVTSPVLIILPSKLNSANDPILDKFAKKEIISLYTKKMFCKEIVPELGMTYGDKLFSKDGKNQISWIVKKLKTNVNSKSATVSLLDSEEHDIDKKIPCLTTVDFKIVKNSLNLYAFFRSQNALNAYGNFYGLKALQDNVGKQLNVSSGQIHIWVTSPHVYVEDLEEIEGHLGEFSANQKGKVRHGYNCYRVK